LLGPEKKKRGAKKKKTDKDSKGTGLFLKNIKKKKQEGEKEQGVVSSLNRGKTAKNKNREKKGKTCRRTRKGGITACRSRTKKSRIGGRDWRICAKQKWRAAKERSAQRRGS